MTCARCHRWLHRTPIFIGGSAYGPKCATAVAGSKPRHGITMRLSRADVRQGDLFSSVHQEGAFV
jgi:hypothetical protein